MAAAIAKEQRFTAVSKADGPAPFQRNSLREDGEKRNVWFFYAPRGVKPEHLTDDPGRWVVMQDLLKNRFDRIEVVADDGTWWAEVLVNSSNSAGVQMVLLRSVILPERMEDTTDRLPAGYRFDEDAQLGLVITRLKDGARVGNAIDQNWKRKEDAVRWLLDQDFVRNPR